MLTEPRLTVNQPQDRGDSQMTGISVSNSCWIEFGGCEKTHFLDTGAKLSGGNSTPCVLFLSAEHKTRPRRFISASTSRRNQDVSGHVQLRFRLRSERSGFIFKRSPNTWNMWKHDQRLISVQFWKRPRTVHTNTKRKRLMRYFF